MRKLILLLVAATFVLAALGAAIAVGVHGADAMNGMTITVNGETFDGPLLAATLGGGVAIGIVIVCLTVVAVLASVAIVVPVLLALVAVAVLFALVVGLAPVLVPVLLLVGAYVLLYRWIKRRSAARSASLPGSPTIS